MPKVKKKLKKKITPEMVDQEIEVEEEVEEEEAEPVSAEPASEKPVAVAKAKAKQAGVPQNVIGDVSPPKDPDDPDDVKNYMKRVEEKLDRALAAKEAPPKEAQNGGAKKEAPKKRGMLYWE